MEQAQWRSFCAVEEEALVGLFRASERVLSEAGLRLADIDAVLLCRGPGSLLGLRLAAMALVGWQSLPAWQNKPVWSYLSLEAAWWSLEENVRRQEPVLCCDYREGKWITLESSNGSYQREWHLRSRDELEALTVPLYRISQRFREQPAPAKAIPLTYDLRSLPSCLPHLSLHTCLPGRVLEIYEPDPTTYRTWWPDRHRKQT